MKLKDQTPQQVQAIADAAGFRPGVLKLVGNQMNLDIELRDGKPVVMDASGAATELKAHIAAQEDGVAILEALALEPSGITFPGQTGPQGGAADPLAASIDNYSKRRYGHVLENHKPKGQFDHVLNPNKDRK